jgi:hypothetical protein
MCFQSSTFEQNKSKIQPNGAIIEHETVTYYVSDGSPVLLFRSSLCISPLIGGSRTTAPSLRAAAPPGRRRRAMAGSASCPHRALPPAHPPSRRRLCLGRPNPIWADEPGGRAVLRRGLDRGSSDACGRSWPPCSARGATRPPPSVPWRAPPPDSHVDAVAAAPYPLFRAPPPRVPAGAVGGASVACGSPRARRRRWAHPLDLGLGGDSSG